MSPREVVDRVAYAVFLARERRAHGRGALSAPGRLGAALCRDLRGEGWRDRLIAARASTPARFFASVYEREALRALFASHYRDERDRMLDDAAAARAHKVAFFGEVFDAGTTIDWHADPGTGRRWPQVYHADVPVHRGDVGFGDVKFVWEINRHQFLVDLAKATFVTGDPAWAEAAFDMLRAWRADNPYGTGVSWACALEPAFRAWSWLWTYHLSADVLAAAPDLHVEVLEGLYDHGHFLHRHLEWYSSPFNHLIGEAATLYALGVLLPEVEESAAWRARGRHVLESRLPMQFYEDGGTSEQSSFYHHATLGFYLLALLLGERNNDPLSPAVRDAVERALGFSAALVQPNGRVPAVGGADDGKPIRLEASLPLWDFRPYQAVGAAVFGRPEWKAVAGRFHEDALWLSGVEGSRRFEDAPAAVPPPTAVMPASGYVITRDGGPGGAYLMFDCGEQALGIRRDDVPNSMHGHADALSVVLWLGGRELLVDSGFYCYNGPRDWEIGFRRTPAHNTLTIDGYDQARHLWKMAWCEGYQARLEHADVDGRVFVASHDGFRRVAPGLVHRRGVWLADAATAVIVDAVVGGQGHTATLHFHVAPGVEVAEAGDRLQFATGGQWLTTTGAPTRRTVVRGGDDPRGWVARSLGVKAAATYVAIETTVAAPVTTLVTVLALPDEARPRRAIRHEGGRVVVDDDRDGIEIVVPQSPGAAAPLATCSRWRDGRRAWSREIGRTE